MKMSFLQVASMLGIALIGLVVVIFIFAQIYNRFLATTVAGGVSNASFAPCVPKPNCVSSMSEVGSEKYINPIKHIRMSPVSSKEEQGEEQERYWQNLLDKIGELSRVKTVRRDDRYAHFVFSSLVMGYPDDVELLWVPERAVIEVRSASRVGYSDFGVNRKRVEMLRTLVE